MIHEQYVCPVCGIFLNLNEEDMLLNMNFEKFDSSVLYNQLKLYSCSNCGHIFNIVSNKQIKDLQDYYNTEYSVINTNNKKHYFFSQDHYKKIYNFLKPHLKSSSKILDIGCANGGFIDFLNKKNIRNVYGIDCSKEYLKQINLINIVTEQVKIGSAEQIPHEDSFFDIVVLDQVLEHVANPRKVFQEIRRVLKNNGILYVGVPDASKYNDSYFYDFYWLMREHIQHFDLSHLRFLAGELSFTFINQKKVDIVMLDDKMNMPGIGVIFKKTTSKLSFIWELLYKCFSQLRIKIANYIKTENSRLENNKKIINNFLLSQDPLYFWGIGKEFMYLYANTDISSCNVASLIDTNKYKQEHMTFKGKKIKDPSVLAGASENSYLFITAVAYTDKIKEQALQQGYKGQFVLLK